MRKRYAKYIPSLTATAYWDRLQHLFHDYATPPMCTIWHANTTTLVWLKPEVMKEYAAEAERLKKN